MNYLLTCYLLDDLPSWTDVRMHTHLANMRSRLWTPWNSDWSDRTIPDTIQYAWTVSYPAQLFSQSIHFVLLLTAAKEPQSYLIVNRDRQSDLDACAQSVLASIMINRVGLRSISNFAKRFPEVAQP